MTEFITDRRAESSAAGQPDETPLGSATDREPWLTDRQQQAWRTFLAMWRMLDDSIERDMQQNGGIPHAYYLIMAMLSEAPNRQLRMNRLAEVVGFSQSRLSHAVARLEELGWLQRQQAPADKRGQIAALTDNGFRQLVEVAPLHAETVRSIMFDPLSDTQVEAFEELCRTILQARPDYEQQLRHIDPKI
ncbi:MAG: MarR family transcriptional regulator [Actinomycetota bacterium]|nr:MarR family transcriptional regulator [Actinomycetota bacterium]